MLWTQYHYNAELMQLIINIARSFKLVSILTNGPDENLT